MIGVLQHPKIERSAPLADEITEWLIDRGHSPWRGSVWEAATLETEISQSKLLIVLGGDGSILRGSRVAAAYSVPVFSVNLGRVGFLSEASVDNWPDKLTAVLNNEHWIEKRLMLEAHLIRDGKSIADLNALNEFVIGRGRQARVVRLHLTINDDFITTYIADGVITATPTGSTAYALAAGGPILPPQLPNFLIMPVAAHLSMDRALVLHANTDVQFRVEMDHEATLTADGQDAFDLLNDDIVQIGQSPHATHFARVGDPAYFYRRLMGNLGLGK